MAKVEKVRPRSRVKFRVVELEVDGDDASLLEGMRTIATAIARGNTPVRTLPKPPSSPGNLEAPADEIAPDEVVEETEDAIEASGEVEDRAVKPRRAKVRTPDAVEIDLVASPTLHEIVDGVDTDKNTDRVLLAAQWMRDHRSIEEFGPGHVYTCFRAAKWSPQPRDYVQLLTDMARKTQVLTKTSNGAFKLSHLGEDRIREMKPTS